MRDGLQDGMLRHWLSQTKFADANVEARLEKEPFILGNMMAKSKPVRAPKRKTKTHAEMWLTGTGAYARPDKKAKK